MKVVVKFPLLIGNHTHTPRLMWWNANIFYIAAAMLCLCRCDAMRVLSMSIKCGLLYVECMYAQCQFKHMNEKDCLLSGTCIIPWHNQITWTHFVDIICVRCTSIHPKRRKRNENKVLKVMAYHVSVGVHFVSKWCWNKEKDHPFDIKTLEQRTPCDKYNKFNWSNRFFSMNVHTEMDRKDLKKQRLMSIYMDMDTDTDADTHATT